MVCDSPEYIRRNRSGRLHCDHGPAIRWRDGWSLYFLNGVRVPQAIAETGAADMDAPFLQAHFLKEQNAEVRREIARKIGADLLCQRLGAVERDRRGDYSLLDLDMGDGRHRPYLKMLNPSIGTWHVEGVHPDCDTVESALNWRNRTAEKPVVVT